MELLIRGSFFRDWDNNSSKELNKIVVDKKDEVISATNLSQISYLKKLRIRTNWYKIELRVSQRKIYWILCVVHPSKNKVEFVRLKPEVFFKKNL